MSGRQFGNTGHEHADFNVARLKSHGHKFEIVVHPDQAVAFKGGAPIEIRDVLVSEKIFFDAQKGLFAGETELRAVFDTTDHLKVATQIIRTGEIQLTAAYREKLREEKRSKITYLIHRNGVDPRTSLPHPVQRINLAIEEAKVRIDEHKSAEDQLQDVIKAIRVVLPIKFEILKIEVHLPAQFANKSYHILKSYGTVSGDTWKNDGSLLTHIEMPAGLQQEFYDAINKATHGAVEIKVVGSR